MPPGVGKQCRFVPEKKQVWGGSRRGAMGMYGKGSTDWEKGRRLKKKRAWVCTEGGDGGRRGPSGSSPVKGSKKRLRRVEEPYAGRGGGTPSQTRRKNSRGLDFRGISDHRQGRGRLGKDAAAQGGISLKGEGEEKKKDPERASSHIRD